MEQAEQCPECEGKGWEIFNENHAEGHFGDVQACDCGIFEFDEQAWEAARAAGILLDEIGGKVLMDARSPVLFGLRLVERAEYGYTYEGARGGRVVFRRHRPGDAKMFVTNRHGNITSVKGNYTWCDSHGVLRPLNPGEHPDAILKRLVPGAA